MYIVQMAERTSPEDWWDLEYDLGEPDHETLEDAEVEMLRIMQNMKPGSMFKIIERAVTEDAAEQPTAAER